MTNQYNTVLYTGVTNDITNRTLQHKQLKYGFTSRYRINKLVYYEAFGSIDEAIKREKQIKAGSRKKKIALIESMNPDWKDLSEG